MPSDFTDGQTLVFDAIERGEVIEILSSSSDDVLDRVADLDPEISPFSPTEIVTWYVPEDG